MSDDPAIEILHKATDILQQTKALLKQIEGKFGELETPQLEWVNKYTAAKIVCKHWKTLDKWRTRPDKGLYEGIHWVKDSGEITYNAFLLRDWYVHRGSPTDHLRAIDAYASSLPSNKPKRRRKAS